MSRLKKGMVRIDGNKLRARRTKLGLSQSDLAQNANVSRQTIYELENILEKSCSVDIVTRIAKAVECQPIDLIRKST